jgi:hypothetical protein
MMTVASKRYRSFISYSQKDKAWGRRLQSWLETYRVPVGIIADVQDGRRLGRFFRDEAEMPAASDIAEVVREAIEVADSLIVVCSPRSAQSKWVAAEIAHFRATHPNGKLFAVIIDGVANSGDPWTECFPEGLRRRGPDKATMPVEPVGVDVRVDSKDRICARLAAGLLDVDFDDLWQRDRRRAERRQRRALISVSSVAAGFAALAGAALWFGLEAREQTREAQAARNALQQEYLAVLGESAIDDVLTTDLDPGALTVAPGGDWMTLMRRDDNAFAVAREFGEGRVIAAAHDGILDAARTEHGGAFLRRAIGWLAGPGSSARVAVTSGHCEWMVIGTEDWAMPSLLPEWGPRFDIRDLPAPVSDDALADVDVLIVGNAWAAFTLGELDAIERFVREGGGVMIVGLGWSWVGSVLDPAAGCLDGAASPTSNDLSAYPMNALGGRFGVTWIEG